MTTKLADTAEKRADWDNLKDVKCPLCGGQLKFSESVRRYYCSKPIDDCNFSIYKGKFDSLIDQMYKDHRKNIEKSFFDD